jgi:hypothetical protein
MQVWVLQLQQQLPQLLQIAAVCWHLGSVALAGSETPIVA